ncbi:MAG: MlaD family protein, partial [Gammaproteobacteria bacterium]
VKGLRVGSNVTFRGVRVGAVTDLELIADIETLGIAIRVEFETDGDAFHTMKDGKIIDRKTARDQVSMRELVDAGLRAKLASESLVTGQLLVQLDFQPETEAIFRGHDERIPEIPSVQSDIQQALQNIEQLFDDIQNNVDWAKLFNDIQSAAKGIEELSNSEDLRESIEGLNTLVNSQETQRLPGQLEATLKDTQTLMQNTDKEIAAIAKDLDKTLAQAEGALRQAKATLQEDSALSYQLNNTLIEIGSAAKSLRILTDYLQQHPEALISGKDEE